MITVTRFYYNCSFPFLRRLQSLFTYFLFHCNCIIRRSNFGLSCKQTNLGQYVIPIPIISVASSVVLWVYSHWLHLVGVQSFYVHTSIWKISSLHLRRS